MLDEAIMALRNHDCAMPHQKGGVTMGIRINLSLDEALYKLLEEDANQHNCTVNGYLTTMLEQTYKQIAFDYPAAGRSRKDNGELKFISRAAVYRRGAANAED